MSWMKKLYDTYNHAYDYITETETNKTTLVPIGHISQKAHINIVLDGSGEFRRASVLDSKTVILLPVTEKSQGRSGSEPPPHPLSDKLRYVAGDYLNYGGKKFHPFEAFKGELKNWCESDYKHSKACCVYQYISKKQVLKDLVRVKIIYVDENNCLLTNWPYAEEKPALFKVLGNDGQQDDALVCWSVENESDIVSNTWTDKSLQESWSQFFLSHKNKNASGFCFVTGNEMIAADSHPKFIRHPGDKAKLISSNDKDGFTFKGRFSDKKEVLEISIEASQKAHNALRWLIEQQGYHNENQVIVAWAVSNNELPNPFEYPLDEENPIDWLDKPALEEIDNSSFINHSNNLGQQFSNDLKKWLLGYQKKLKAQETVTIMSLDSATEGRMGITYYRELNENEFFEKVAAWYRDFSWLLPYFNFVEKTKKKDKKNYNKWRVMSPTPLDIFIAAYGNKTQSALKKKMIERLLSIIHDGTSFPKDLLDACVRNASNPNAPMYNKNKEFWIKNISIACALFKGYSIRNVKKHNRRTYQMGLERDCKTRDYLYGRLLAISESIENLFLKNLDKNEKRPTNAERFMQRFSCRPFSTWKTINEALIPYKNRLRTSANAKLLHNFESEMGEICNLFERNDFINDKPLTGEYLLGYFCQKYKKSEKKMVNDVNEE